MQIGLRITEVINLMPKMWRLIRAKNWHHLLIAAETKILMVGSILIRNRVDIVDIASFVNCVRIGYHINWDASIYIEDSWSSHRKSRIGQS